MYLPIRTQEVLVGQNQCENYRRWSEQEEARKDYMCPQTCPAGCFHDGRLTLIEIEIADGDQVTCREEEEDRWVRAAELNLKLTVKGKWAWT